MACGLTVFGIDARADAIDYAKWVTKTASVKRSIEVTAALYLYVADFCKYLGSRDSWVRPMHGR